MVTQSILFLCTTIPLMSMETVDDAKIKEMTHFLYVQEIKANALRGDFPSRVLPTPSWMHKKHPQGYIHDMPACLIENNKANFNGIEKSALPFLTNPDFFRKSNNGRYSARIGTELHPQDAVVLTTYDNQKNKTVRSLCCAFKYANKICFNPTSTHVITGAMGDTNTLQTWDLVTGKLQQTLQGHKGLITVIEYNHAGTKMITISHRTITNTIILWDTSTGYSIQPINKIEFTSDYLTEARFSPADDRIFVSCAAGDIIVLDGRTGTIIATTSADVPIKDEATIKAIFTPDNQFCITTTVSTKNGATHLWDTHTGKKIAALLNHNIPNNCNGVGLMLHNCSVITTFDSDRAMMIDLISDKTRSILHYLQHEATSAEKIALYCIYCAYKKDTPSCLFPSSMVNALPSRPAIRDFIKKHLFWNKNLIQLDDRSYHILEPHEIESSSILLQKQLLREKTTPAHVKKWGYTIECYDRLEKAPLYLNNISSAQLNLFKRFLNLDPSKWNNQFHLLSLQQQDDLFFIASEKGLGVCQLMAQLAEVDLLPEIIEKNITPHFFIKDVRNYLRYHIIVDNARNKRFTEKTYVFSDKKEWHFNAVLDKMMFVPDAAIKKGLYRFSGSIDAADIVLEGKEWACTIQKKRDDNLIYYITPTITNDEMLQLPVKTFPTNECILWAVDSNKNIFYKKNIQCDGRWNNIKFSPDGNYIAISAESTATYPHHTVALISLGAVEDASCCKEMILPIDSKIMSLCFNDQSTVLATGTSSERLIQSSITLWDIATGQQLSCVSNPLGGKVKNLCFNHSGTKMFATYDYGYDGFSGINLFDVTDYTHPKEIISHNLINDLVCAQAYFSDDDTKIVATLTEGNLIFMDGITGAIINDKEKESYSNARRQIASVFNHDNSLLVSAKLAQFGYLAGDTLLWDTGTGTVIATLISGQAGVNGVGFTPDKRHVVTTCESKIADAIIMTTLFDLNTHNALKWLKHGTSFLQKYVLYCAYKAQQDKNSKSKQIPYVLQHVLGLLPKDAYNAKEIIEKFLQKKLW